jgi:hypothetical protein
MTVCFLHADLPARFVLPQRTPDSVPYGDLRERDSERGLRKLKSKRGRGIQKEKRKEIKT